MHEIHHHAGNVIFLEGDPSEDVAFIVSGRVEIEKRTNAHSVVIGEVGAGEFVGEMGVIEGRPRVATVTAKSDVRLRLLTQGEFTDRLSHEPDLALQILTRLSERLRAANERLAEAQAHEPSGDEDDPSPVPVAVPAPPAEQPTVAARGAVRLFAGSAHVEGCLPGEGLEVTSFPFRVGRPTGRRESAPSVSVGLLVPDRKPYRLSRAHFAIVREGEGFAVRDVRSHLGTVVNGEMVGQHAPRSYAVLREGENQVVAGGKDSPHVFRIVVSNA